MVEFNLFSLFGVSIHFHLHWAKKRDEVKGPDQIQAGSHTALPSVKQTAHGIIDLNWFVRHPVTGDLIPIRNVPPHLATRAVEFLQTERR
jgi:hypothetical protein